MLAHPVEVCCCGHYRVGCEEDRSDFLWQGFQPFDLSGGLVMKLLMAGEPIIDLAKELFLRSIRTSLLALDCICQAVE
ncbi:hypothetical protein QQL38_13635 [Pseudomonas syringae]|uniref:hypothetical protein n=1 Tax=Pseudomonas syringae TaxID=317 RepID=UPI001BCBA2A2|nr:hypothetical protein [Pseudomonas syringae]MBS7472744.1 hypothetical protein [Pseudomonas syringae]MCL6305464.1 hypothetical protein [Pseudomonas syringae]